MKVLFISEYFPPDTKGGGEISCFLLAKYLSQKGIEVHILTSKSKNKHLNLKNKDFKVHRLLDTGKNPSSVFSNIKRIIFFPNSVKKNTARLLKKYKFDLIHYFNITSIDGTINTKIPKIMHLNSPIIFSPEATKKDNIIKNYSEFDNSILDSKKIGKIKNYWFFKYNPLFKKFLYTKFKSRISKLKNINFFIPISSSLKNNLKKIGIKDKEIEVLPNIIETNKSIKNKCPKDKLKIIYLGEYVDFKGVFDLLKALKNLKRNYVCDFYGSGSEKGKILNFIKDNSLNVKVNGKIPHKKVPIILAKHNVLVFPSRIEEAFGRVLVEAMASGCIPISSFIGGTKDIIEEGKNGYFFEPGNSKSLNKLLKTLNLGKINKNNLKNSVKRYSGNNISSNLINIYKSIIHKANKTDKFINIK